MPEPERVYGWARFGPIARASILGLALNAIGFLVLAAVLGELWPIFVFVPSALLALMFVGLAFGPDIDEE